MSEDASCGWRKQLPLFHKGRIIGLHQADKTTKDTAETAKVGLKAINTSLKPKGIEQKTLHSSPMRESQIVQQLKSV